MADKKIKVRAIKRGQRPDRTWAEPGETFTIPESKFSTRWMEKVAEKVPAAKPAGQASAE